GPRVELEVLAGALAGHADFRARVHVAHVGTGEPGLVDVHVYADGADGALGGLQADDAVQAGHVLVAEVGFVIAQAHERTEGLAGLAEVPLAAQRDRLLLDGAQLAQAVAADPVVELVGRAPQLHREVLGGVPAGAQGRGRAAVDPQAIARIGGLHVGDATDHGEALVGRG